MMLQVNTQPKVSLKMTVLCTHTTDYSPKIKHGGRKSGSKSRVFNRSAHLQTPELWIGCKLDAIEAQEERIAHLAELNGQERVTATCTGVWFKRQHY
jgi:hypothetical protein